MTDAQRQYLREIARAYREIARCHENRDAVAYALITAHADAIDAALARIAELEKSSTTPPGAAPSESAKSNTLG